MEHVTILTAFGAGLLSFLSPCILPLMPIYIAILIDSDNIKDRNTGQRFNVFFHSLSFVIGFTLVFTLLGAGFGLIGLAFYNHIVLLRNISGSLLIFFGLFILAAQKISWLNYGKYLRPSTKRATGYMRSLVIGGVFTLAWTPCVSPILAGILTLAVGAKTALHGAYLLVIYSLGLGLPFLALGAAFDKVNPFLKKIDRYSGLVYIISAILLIAVGILILTNRLTWLQGG